FNPCFYGTRSSTKRDGAQSLNIRMFQSLFLWNPLFNNLLNLADFRFRKVSILVFMEPALQLQFLDFLNPFFMFFSFFAASSFIKTAAITNFSPRLLPTFTWFYHQKPVTFQVVSRFSSLHTDIFVATINTAIQ
ncbi:MAG: hypothetical protein QME78_16080, partial [Thermodesulfobacteriota bacterium]|nr:hypothetical protein [Thermodesulfobacteriota bacterium]